MTAANRPVERAFQEMRKELADNVFSSIQQAQDIVCDALVKVPENLETVIKLTKFHYNRYTQLVF